MTETEIRLAIASLAISITMGVFLHDSHLDMATVSAITRVDLTSKDVAEGKVFPELHAHDEHVSVKKAGRHVSYDPRNQLKNRQKKTSPKLTNSGNPTHIQYD